MPIPLGILAAAGVRPTAGGSYELIETITVGSGGAASVTFSNLNTYSTTYQHLQIRAVARSTTSANLTDLNIQFNGDSATNYNYHQLYGSGSSVASEAYLGLTSAPIVLITAANATASSLGAGVIDILDPYEAKNKTVRGLSGYTANTNYILLRSGLWRSTASVTSITLLASGGNLAQFSRFSIYGLKVS